MVVVANKINKKGALLAIDFTLPFGLTGLVKGR